MKLIYVRNMVQLSVDENLLLDADSETTILGQNYVNKPSFSLSFVRIIEEFLKLL